MKRTMPFSIYEIEHACPGVSRNILRLVLRAMKSEGLLEPLGRGRSAKCMIKVPREFRRTPRADPVAAFIMAA
jgi:hypothetical protein